MRTIHAAAPFAIRRIFKALSKIDMFLAWAIPSIIGCVIVIAGCAVEAHGQLDLLRTSGLDAYNAYQSFHTATALSLFEFMHRGLEGALTTFGGNIQARGFLVLILGPTISLLTIISCRILSKFDAQRVALTPALAR